MLISLLTWCSTHRVINENYAFLMESTTIDYETERNCKVIKVSITNIDFKLLQSSA